MARNWANFDLAKEAGEVLLEMQDEVLDLNKEQLRSGERSDRTNIRPKYTKKYENYKRRRFNYGLDGTPNLNRFGNFYRGFMLQITNPNKYKIDSTDGKRNDIVDKYNQFIFGLTNESKYFIQPKMQSALVRRMMEKIFR